MNFRLTAILFGVVFLLVTGLLIYALTSGDPAVSADGPFAPLTAAGVKPDDVTTVEITRTEPTEETLVFEKADGRWRLTAPTAGGAESAALDSLVRDLLALKPTEYTGAVDRASTGLAPPTVSITLRAGDRSHKVYVGTTTAGSDQAVTFLAPADAPNALPVAVLARGLRDSLFRPEARTKNGSAAVLIKWRTDFRPRQLLDVDFRDPTTDAEAVAVSRGENRVALARTPAGEWRFTAPAGYGLADVGGSPDPDPDRFTGVRPLINAVQFLQIFGPADVIENVPAADLPKYGLADADSPVRVDLTPNGKPARTLFLGKEVLGADGKPVLPARRYVRVAGDSAVFLVTTDVVSKLVNTLTDPSSLRTHDLLSNANLTKVDAVNSTVGGGFQLRRIGTGPAAEWVLYGTGEPVAAQRALVQNVLARLGTPRVAVSVLPKPDDSAFDAQNLQGELTVWFNGLDKAKAVPTNGQPPADLPPPTGVPVTLKFGRQFTKKVPGPGGMMQDQLLAVVRRTQGDDVTDFEVPQDVAVLAVQPRLKFVDARPPSFVPAAATRLVLFRDGTRSEYVKNPTATDPAYPRGVWNVGDDKGPVADGLAIQNVLTTLATLPAVLSAEKAADLASLGLDPANPRVSAKVTVPADGGTKDEEFHFGNPVKDDEKLVHLKVVGKPFVYTVPATVVENIRTADLTDKVVIRLDPEKIKRLKLRGWRTASPEKAATEVTAEQQNGVWVVSEPKGATADTARLKDWAEALRAANAVAPVKVEPGQEPPAAYGFADDPLTVFVELTEGPGLALTLGGLNAEKSGLYARRIGTDDYYLLDAKPFLPLLASPPLAGR